MAKGINGNNKSTIKLSKETKEKLINLDISRKNKSFEEIILELIKSYGEKNGK
ncbi:MAG: hypothetical protein IB618_02960 [Candidatus Pacearchaeota archaeon]|nr:MAG: hypothetical protein IB618_02960 [Candidatus Pacearchaeota archaeon]